MVATLAQSRQGRVSRPNRTSTPALLARRETKRAQRNGGPGLRRVQRMMRRVPCPGAATTCGLSSVRGIHGDLCDKFDSSSSRARTANPGVHASQPGRGAMQLADIFANPYWHVHAYACTGRMPSCIGGPPARTSFWGKAAAKCNSRHLSSRSSRCKQPPPSCSLAGHPKWC